jgi:L-ascorbate metabolism protein UlaG (beta-lactamase superfamily)
MDSQTLALTYIGGPTALFTFGPLRFLTDPTFDPAGTVYPGPSQLHKLSGPTIDPAGLGPFDYVLLSHDHHADNLDQAGREVLSKAKAVLTTEAGADRLRGNSIGLSPGRSIDLEADGSWHLRVTATPARHGPEHSDRGPVIGFTLHYVEAPETCVYFSGDTVWYDGVAQLAASRPIRAAILNLGAARVPQVGPFHLTMTAAEAVEFARACPSAAIVPLHFEGWAHFSEGRHAIAREFSAAGLTQRLHWPKSEGVTEISL